MTTEIHRCCGEFCPGLTYRASEVPHPPACSYGPGNAEEAARMAIQRQRNTMPAGASESQVLRAAWASLECAALLGAGAMILQARDRVQRMAAEAIVDEIGPDVNRLLATPELMRAAHLLDDMGKPNGLGRELLAVIGRA
jgi:hypothetical protein